MAGRTAYGQGNAGMRPEPRGRMAAPGFDFAQAEADRAMAGGEPPFNPLLYTSGGEYPATPATIMYDRSQSGIPISNEEFMAVSALSPRQSEQTATNTAYAGEPIPAPQKPDLVPFAGTAYEGTGGPRLPQPQAATFMPRPAFGGAMGGFSPYGFGRPPMGAGKGGYRPPMYGGFGMRPDRFRGGPMGGNVNFAGPPMMPPMYGGSFGMPPLGQGGVSGGQLPLGGGRMAAPGYNVATGSFDNAGFGPVETATIVDPAPEPVMESGGIGSFGGANQPTNPYSMGYGMGFRQQQPMGGGKGGSAGGKGGAR